MDINFKLQQATQNQTINKGAESLSDSEKKKPKESQFEGGKTIWEIYATQDKDQNDHVSPKDVGSSKMEQNSNISIDSTLYAGSRVLSALANKIMNAANASLNIDIMNKTMNFVQSQIFVGHKEIQTSSEVDETNIGSNTDAQNQQRTIDEETKIAVANEENLITQSIQDAVKAAEEEALASFMEEKKDLASEYDEDQDLNLDTNETQIALSHKLEGKVYDDAIAEGHLNTSIGNYENKAEANAKIDSAKDEIVDKLNKDDNSDTEKTFKFQASTGQDM